MDTFRPFLDGRHVTPAVRLCPGTPYVRGSRAAIESIVTNVVNNSLTAFESAGTMDRRIEIVRHLRQVAPEARIMCTQLSRFCAKSIPTFTATHLSPTFALGRSDRVCCGGTILVSLRDATEITPATVARWPAIGNECSRRPRGDVTFSHGSRQSGTKPRPCYTRSSTATAGSPVARVIISA